MDYQEFNGKAALVTGSGKGIGRSIALALARKGMTVALTARTMSDLQTVKSEIEDAGGKAVCFAADLTAEAEVIALMEKCVSHLGRLDVLVNNAGMGVFKDFSQTTAAELDVMMNINFRAPFLLCREAIRHLSMQPVSYIINIGSVLSVKGYSKQAGYSASKHALLGMSKALAKEVQPMGIRVHVICPGGVDTEMAAQSRPDLDRSVLIKPEEVAEIVTFLISQSGNAVIDEIDIRRVSATPWA